MDFKYKYISLKQTLDNYKTNGFYPIHYYNFWTDQLAKDIWFSKFIEHHGLIKGHRKRINFYSVLGPLQNLASLRNGVNIFFSGENMHTERFDNYRKLCTNKQFDLYIDFDTTLGEKSIRFPLWILYMFRPDSDYEDIKKRVNQLRHSIQDDRQGFCSLVASHDWNGIRGEIIDALSEIGTISSGGKFRNNTDELNTRYANYKHDFIRQFKFNICPENSNAEGYVTEKLFQAIAAGCIPIYWGSNNQPEPNILNQDAILFWNQHENNQNTMNTIREIHTNPTKYHQFISQPRFLPNAAEVIWNYFQSLETKLSEIIRNY
jgi:hypothetical protein